MVVKGTKQLLRESIFDKTTHHDIIMKALQFAKQHLGVHSGVVELAFDRSKLTTTASYGNGRIIVYAHERAVCDLIRSIFHELVHLKQDLEGRISDHQKDGSDGSPIENEANAKAGEMVRIFGKIHPEIYE